MESLLKDEQRLLEPQQNLLMGEQRRRAGGNNGILLCSEQSRICIEGRQNTAAPTAAELEFDVDVWSGFSPLFHTNSGSQKKKTSVTMLEFD